MQQFEQHIVQGIHYWHRPGLCFTRLLLGLRQVLRQIIIFKVSSRPGAENGTLYLLWCSLVLPKISLPLVYLRFSKVRSTSSDS